MSDEVETSAREAGHRGVLAFEFLHVVLAELAQSECLGFADDLARGRLW